MINKIKEKVNTFITSLEEEETPKTVIMDSGAPEPDMRVIGLFTDVAEDKVAELVQGLIYMDELNKLEENPALRRPIDFYLSTYGGAADDMFALYDVMRQVQKTDRDSYHRLGQSYVSRRVACWPQGPKVSERLVSTVASCFIRR